MSVLIILIIIVLIAAKKKIHDTEFNSTKNSIDEMIDKHMFEADENRKALEEEQKIQEILETLQKVYRVGEDSVTNDILNGRGLKKILG